MTDFEWTLKEIERNARKLARLFDDPQPGLFTWLTVVGETMERIAQLRTVEAAPQTKPVVDQTLATEDRAFLDRPPQRW